MALQNPEKGCFRSAQNGHCLQQVTGAPGIFAHVFVDQVPALLARKSRVPLVGGTAAAVHAGHRISFDHDHVVKDLAKNYDAAIRALESIAGWHTHRRVKGKMVLGNVNRSLPDGATSGALRRSKPPRSFFEMGAAFDCQRSRRRCASRPFSWLIANVRIAG